MISRDTAATIRYDIVVGKRPKGLVARENDITVSSVDRIVEGALVPIADERVVIPPNYTPRKRKITPEERVKIAHLICYGATLQRLADDYGVAVRAIQHIKEGFTARVGKDTKNSRPPQGDLSHNLVAEARYRHHVQGEAVGMIAAGLFVKYKNIYRAVVGKTYKPSHGLRLTAEGSALDPEGQTGRSLRLWIYGADAGFISDTTDIPRDAVRSLVDAYTETKP